MADREHNVAAALLADLDARGERVALRQGARIVSYAELADQVARAAGLLASLGLRPGDRVAVYMPDCIESAIALLGAVWAGGVAVPVSELGAASDVRDLLNHSGAALAVVHRDLVATLDSIRAEAPGLREVLAVDSPAPALPDFAAALETAPSVQPAAVEPDDVAFLLYSAGARSEDAHGGAVMRGVPHTHATPLAAYASYGRDFLQLGPVDRVLSVVRFSTAYGLGTGLLFPLAAGCEAVLHPEQPSSQRIFAVLDDVLPSVLFATPSLYGQLARDAAARGLHNPLAALRACVSGAEDMPPRVIAMARQILGAEVTVGYGLTEAFQFVIAGPASSGRPGACGRPLSGFELRIVDDDGAVVGADVIGTLELRGPTLAGGYWNEPSASSARDGWFTTRDRFMVDEAGNYYHCGRVDQLFKVGGKWVEPDEVERALLSNEAVWECAVIGADDEDGLIKPLAFVVPNVGHVAGDELERALREYVKTELAPYKYPRWIEFVDELPKGPHGGILRYKLRDRLRGSHRRRRAETSTPA